MSKESVNSPDLNAPSLGIITQTQLIKVIHLSIYNSIFYGEFESGVLRVQLFMLHYSYSRPQIARHIWLDDNIVDVMSQTLV